MNNIRRVGALGAFLCIGLAAIVGSGGGNDSGNPTFDAPVTLSGTLDEGGRPAEGVTVRALVVPMPATDEQQRTTTSGSTGDYAIDVRKNTSTYIELSKAGFATLNSRIGAFSQDTGGLDFGMVSLTEAESAIDTAFGGMAFDLPDKGWLAVNVEDPSGSEVDGVAITSLPVISGGGALNCDGTLTGADITATIPACNPERGGPMYLAYFDTDAEVTLTASGVPDPVVAPVRQGEVTVVSIVWSGGNATMGTLQVEAEDGGTVTTNPAVLQCIGPATCEAQVALGTAVTLTATPAAGSHFDDWDGCDVEVMSDRTGGICERTISEFNFIRAEFDPGAP